MPGLELTLFLEIYHEYSSIKEMNEQGGTGRSDSIQFNSEIGVAVKSRKYPSDR